ncbi:protein kinase domain-containing protein [Colletotrichum graminicola M1.001]|uniref:Protein kinase domain-containing protein n=1 Tax=Colletotrichum graminicola (strain M1.001 / M2 / FGSC 10212) TaxID=645133 RepID=E3Q9V3_COLGM|nr:protein kinase domain-containing protein [Colletotrichum graminicola M1.001]EFQ27641.1 protein kinase domain-containing protein [Colletotrichum graminicola M1.001]
MAQTSPSPTEPPPTSGHHSTSFLRKLFGRNNAAPAPVGPLQAKEPEPEPGHEPDPDDPQSTGLVRRVSRKVVPGLPRVQTFKRQQSERRNNLAPVEPSPAERRALSVDRRVQSPRTASQAQSFPRASAPDFLENTYEIQSASSAPASPVEEKAEASLNQMVAPVSAPTFDDSHVHELQSNSDAHSVTTSQSQYEAMIHDELETTWILNLSMHFRDKSKREKFFVTYRETPTLWRRVTISLDYRNAPDNSLELDLMHTKSQRDKSSKIYEAIRDSLQDIQFYHSVTNLKLQTTDGRLHVHVVEDVNEIIQYPTVRQVQHLGCRRIRERDIDFDSHMSGFVYKVRVGGDVLIKKEIPGPDTIDEFLYEINALNRLRYSRNIIRFHGVVVDDDDEYVKGLLISYAVHGALIDVIYDNQQESELGLPWPVREKWARQIVQGLADIHESGFVQGDFTLSNIVIDDEDNAKIIDINRRGCPVGWEPPEATPLIESNQRISMYIGVKSDLYQLGMVLWALAAQDDEPEAQGRPLQLTEEHIVPAWYREMVDICLSDDPRLRLQASSLMALFPEPAVGDDAAPPSISVDDGYTMQEYFVEGYQGNGHARVKTAEPAHDWSYVNLGHTYADPTRGFSQDPYYYTRGRSPPSPLPSHYGRCDSPHMGRNISSWAEARNIAPSYSDVGGDEIDDHKSTTPTTSKDSIATPELTDETSRSMQQRLEELQWTPLSNDFAAIDRAELDQTPGQVDKRLAGEELSRVVSGTELTEPHAFVDPIASRPSMASPLTVKNVDIEGDNAGGDIMEEAGQVGNGQYAEPDAKETAGQTVPLVTGKTEPKNQLNSNDISSESGNIAVATQLMEHEDRATTPSTKYTTTANPTAAEFEAENESVDVAEQQILPALDAKIPSKDDTTPKTDTDDKTAAPSSPVAGNPELNGVGAAYLDTDEQKMREKESLDDDFSSNTVALAAPTATMMTAVEK